MNRKPLQLSRARHAGVVLLAALAAIGLCAALAQKPKSSKPRTARPSPTKAQAPPAPASAAPAGPPVEAIRANNLGVALMDLREYPEAVGRFQTACILLPDSETGCVNAGIGFLAMKHYDEARRMLGTAATRDPRNPRAWFNLGLLDRAQSRGDAALSDFAKAAALDPADASALCLLGLAQSDNQQFPEAAASFRKSIEIDPLNLPAERGLADALARTGDTAGAASHLQRAQQLIALGSSAPLGTGYGGQGKYSFAEVLSASPDAPPSIPVHFEDVTRLAGLPGPAAPARGGRARGRGAAVSPPPPAARSMADFLGSGACVFDYDGDGRPDIFLVDADGSGAAALFRNLGQGKFADVTAKAKIDFRGTGTGCAVGDYDNDGHPDFAIGSDNGVRLYHNQGDGTFSDVTATSGLSADGLSLGLAFVDCDRDGDLDLFISRFRDFPLENPSQPFPAPSGPPPGNMLWRNHGDGTFVDATASLGLSGDSSSTGALISDFSGRRALDLLLTGWRSVPELFENPREDAFLPAQPWGTETQGPTAAGVALDFDHDGRMDVALTHWQPPALGLWRNTADGTFSPVLLPDPGWMRGWGIAALDYDNDGWVDLVAVGETFSGEGRIVLLRNLGPKGFRDVTHETGLDRIPLHDPRSILAFDAAGDGSLDLLITQNRRPPVLLKSIGADRHHWMEIALHGDAANTLGLGANVEVFSGALRQSFDLPSASGYLSQGPPVVHAGLADEPAADAVRVRWGEGPVQADIQPPGGAVSTIAKGVDASKK